jgi:hypothetical protein
MKTDQGKIQGVQRIAPPSCPNCYVERGHRPVPDYVGLCPKHASVDALIAALTEIATSEHQQYEKNADSSYGTGVADGHRCAGDIASRRSRSLAGGNQ